MHVHKHPSGSALFHFNILVMIGLRITLRPERCIEFHWKP
jgi:hypothetical protein